MTTETTQNPEPKYGVINCTRTLARRAQYPGTFEHLKVLADSAEWIFMIFEQSKLTPAQMTKKFESELHDRNKKVIPKCLILSIEDEDGQYLLFPTDMDSDGNNTYKVQYTTSKDYETSDEIEKKRKLH